MCGNRLNYALSVDYTVKLAVCILDSVLNVAADDNREMIR